MVPNINIEPKKAKQFHRMILSDKISPRIHLITKTFKMLNKTSSKTKQQTDFFNQVKRP